MRMKAFLTRCSASASHSLIEIALLESLGILEGFFHVRWVHLTNKEKKPFCYFECFGVVKVARFRLVEPEVSKVKYFCSKKRISMLDRTLTTPNNSLYFLLVHNLITLSNSMFILQIICIHAYLEVSASNLAVEYFYVHISLPRNLVSYYL